MPVIMLPNSGVEAAIARPVTLDITNQVMEIMQIPKDTRIVFPGSSETVYQNGSLLSDKDNEPILTGSSQLSIEISERFLEEALGTIAVYQPEHTPFFYDDKLGISAKFVYIPTEVTVEFRYKARSASYLSKIRHDMWARVSNLRDLNVHTVTYNVPVTTDVINILRYLHALRENVAGYGESFENYFLSYACPAMTQISDMQGDKKLYSIQETATRILGMFDFTGVPEKAQKEAEGSSHTLSFAYKFTYEKPVNQVLKFPVAIHNQLVDERFFQNEVIDLNKKKKFYSASIKHFRRFETDQLLDDATGDLSVFYIPSYDDIVYDNKVAKTRTLFSAICSVDENDPRNLLNLNELGDFCLDAEILEYIREVDYQWIYKPYESFLNVSIYRNSYLAHHESLMVDKDLNVLSTKDLDIRVINRVRLSIVDNITEVSLNGIKRLLNYPRVFEKLVRSTHTNRIHLERLRPRIDLTHLFNDYTHIGPARVHWDTNRIQHNTVMLSNTQARRKGIIYPKKDLKPGESIYGKY